MSSGPVLNLRRSTYVNIQQGAPANSRLPSAVGSNLCLNGVMVSQVQDALPYVSLEEDSGTEDLETLASIVRKAAEFYLRRESHVIFRELIVQAPKTNLYSTGMSVVLAVLRLIWTGRLDHRKKGGWIWEALAPLLKFFTAEGREPIQYQGDSAEIEEELNAKAVLSSICDGGRTEPIQLAEFMQCINGVGYDNISSADMPPGFKRHRAFHHGQWADGIWKRPDTAWRCCICSGLCKDASAFAQVGDWYGVYILSCCVVAGIMEGEIWRDIENGTKRLEDIMII